MSSLAEVLSNEILSDKYFLETLRRAELNAAYRVFAMEYEKLSVTQYKDLMRYADILSHSQDALARNLSYKIVSLLAEEPSDLEIFKPFAEAVLAKLGNFPGLSYLSKKHEQEVILPIEREAERGLKETTQKATNRDYTFTDSQYRVRQGLEKYDYFSFSGPTSIGKSFIIKDYINFLLQKPEMATGNIVVLVPTRALIGQVVSELKKEIKSKDVNIASYPSRSTYLLGRYRQSIYVFTPERLLSHISNNGIKINYLFVDEAQKVVAVRDSRSSLYYHSIYEAVKTYATKLIFASPNIPNPEVFLNIFEKDQRGNIAILEQTVAQNRYYVDLIQRTTTLIPEVGDEQEVGASIIARNANQLIWHIGHNTSNLIYCNGTYETVERARDFATTLDDIELSQELRRLIKFIKEYVHEDYYLIGCLRKGVAFHHGRMPQQVRRKVEQLFAQENSPIRYIFCTSTLLEGINLPAKNIFVVNDSHGSNKFKKIDFENLIGRAGRLTKEFSGNVFCVRDKVERWKEGSSLIKRSRPEYVDSFLVNKNASKKAEFLNIGRALVGERLTTQTAGERENINHYASIMLLHHIENESSALKVNFLEKNKDAQGILQSAKRANNVPSSILRLSSTIKPIYQNDSLKYIAGVGHSTILPAVQSADREGIRSVLRNMYRLYRWDIEESYGKEPLIPPGLVKSGYGESKLNYWAMLLEHWVKGEPLSRLIQYSIYYHRQRGEIWFLEQGRQIREDFSGNSKQVNIIIEQVMNDIENGLRFKIGKYLLNYYLLCQFQLGERFAGQNWAEMVEYGTLDPHLVELQNVGFSRSVSMYLLEEHNDRLKFDEEGSLINIDEEGLAESLDVSSDYYNEIMEVLR